TGPRLGTQPKSVDIGLGKEVMCGTDELGHVARLITQPPSGRVTHFVVRNERHEVVVPIESIERTDLGVVYVRSSAVDLGQFPEYRDDDEIQADILNCVFEDPRVSDLDRYTLKIQVKAGVVRLTGRVRSADVKLAVEQIAASRPGVVSVQNELWADDEIGSHV